MDFNEYQKKALSTDHSVNSDVVSAQASISAISATTFTLNWTTNGTTGTNRFYTYKVCK